MLNNGVLIVRYAHTVDPDTSHLPLLARRLLAEISRAPELPPAGELQADAFVIKNKYFEAHLHGIIVDDNVSSSPPPPPPLSSSTCGALDVIATLRAARVPYGIVQLVSLGSSAFAAADLLTDIDCCGPNSGSKDAPPLFNMCLVAAAADKMQQAAPAHLLQPWREGCVSAGVEFVPWSLSDPIATPVPPPAGCERRGLLSKDELSGSSRVLEVATQSLWCDPKRSATRVSQDVLFPRNMFALVSSSRFTCEFGQKLLARAPHITTTLTSSAAPDRAATPTGSCDGQSLTIGVTSKYSLAPNVHCYFTPLALVTGPRTSKVGAAELCNVFRLTPCRVVCFHILASDAVFLEGNDRGCCCRDAVTRQLDRLIAAIEIVAPSINRDDARIIVVENNVSGDDAVTDDDFLEQQEKLNRLGCELVVVDEEDDGTRFDAAEHGPTGIAAIENVFQCAAWAKDPASASNARRAVGENSALVISFGVPSRSVAEFVAQSFSNDAEDCITTTTHEGKTAALAKAVAPSTSTTTAAVHPVELSSKYFSCSVDVVTTSSPSVEHVKSVIKHVSPRVLVALVSTQSSDAAATLLRAACALAEDPEDDDQEESSSRKPRESDDDGIFLLGPHSNAIAVVNVVDAATNADVDARLTSVCQDNFIDVIPRDEEEEGGGRVPLSRSQQLYDALSCVEWPDMVKQQKTTTTTTNSDVISTAAAAAPAASASSTTTQQPRTTTTVVTLGCELPRDFWVNPKTRISEPRPAGEAARNDVDDDDNDGTPEFDEDAEGLADLLEEMREVRDSKRLTAEERRQRAAEVSTKMAKRLHQSDDLADAIAKNII